MMCWSKALNTDVTKKSILLTFDPGVHPPVAAGGGWGPSHGQGSARLVRRREAWPERTAGWVCGDPPGEEHPWREVAGPILLRKLWVRQRRAKKLFEAHFKGVYSHKHEPETTITKVQELLNVSKSSVQKQFLQNMNNSQIYTHNDRFQSLWRLYLY